jgi:hypothetical protein
MKLIGQPQAPVALRAVKELSVPIEYETEWDQEMVWTVGEAPFALAGNRIPDGQARSAVDIPTTLSRLLLSYFVMFCVKPKLMSGPKRVFSVYVTHLA